MSLKLVSRKRQGDANLPAYEQSTDRSIFEHANPDVSDRLHDMNSLLPTTEITGRNENGKGASDFRIHDCILYSHYR